MYENNLDQLKNQMGSKITHVINKNSPLLPFVSREPERVKFNHGFDGIIGEFSRIYSEKSWNDEFEINNLVNNILSGNDKISCSKEDEEALKIFIKEYLINEKQELNILHPHLFLYLPLSDNLEKTGEKRIGEFFNDVFFKDITEFKDFFENKESNQVIIKFILENIPDLPSKDKELKYISILPFVTDVFREDIVFAKEHESFLINNFEYILAFYYFYYVSQFSIKLNQSYEAVSLEEPTETYYLLDWEKASGSRRSVNKGYNLIKEANKNLLVRINIIEQLNILLGTHGLFPFQILNIINEASNQEKDEFLSVLEQWIDYYNEKKMIISSTVAHDYKPLVKSLFNSLDQGIQQAPKSRYGKNLEELAKKYLAKSRGQYGLMLNLNKDFLYIITALCVKENKIKLNDLFDEYERRGLFFDRYSKEEIVTLLNKWNLIDKKSDSGDAQYVKSIL